MLGRRYGCPIEAVVLSASEASPRYHALPLELRKKAKETLGLPPVATVEDLVRRLSGTEVAVRWERAAMAHGSQE